MEQQRMDSPFLSGTPAPTQDEKMWGTIAHLSALATAFVYMPFLGPLLVMLIKGNESAWVKSQAREALNFQILVTAVLWVGAVLFFSVIFACVGIPVMIAGGLCGLVLTILAATKTNNGETFRYPDMLPRLVR